MIRKALKSAIGVSMGVTIGGVVLPRILFSERPPLIKKVGS